MPYRPVADWSDDELAAEIDDLVETGAHLESSLADLIAEHEMQVGRTRAKYGSVEANWPGDSLHAVRQLRNRVDACQDRIRSVRNILVEYRTEQARREAARG